MSSPTTIPVANRIIIGECGQAGYPISAKIVDDAPAGIYQLRWLYNGESFVLERWDDFTRAWQEVPCIMEPRKPEPS